MMIKLVVCDMDGTVIGRDEKIPPDAADFITALEDRGVMFTVATGRAEGYMREKVAEMGLRHPYIATNGATIMEGGRAVIRKQFPIAQIREVVEFARTLGMSVLYTFEGEERVEEITDWIIYEGKKRGVPYQPRPFSEEEWRTLCVDKILIMDPVRAGKINQLEEKVRATPGSFTYVRYRDKALEFNERSANKAAALGELAKLLHVELHEVLAVGDDNNDIEMFQTAGVSAAVGNVSEKARLYADYVCKGEQFEGVKEAVAKFC